MPESVQRYHQVLQLRPDPGYLFDRFYDAWLDYGTPEQMGAFLHERADGGATEDQLLLAFFHARQGEPAQAVAVLRAALEREPGDAAVLFHKAELEARTLDFDTALADLEQAADADPDPELAARIGKLRGQLHARGGDREAAHDIWQALIADHPDDEFLYEDLIDLQLDEGLFDAALATSEALLERTRDPFQRVSRTLRMGDIHQRAGQRDRALAVYAQTLDDVGAETWLEREIFAQVETVFRREDDIASLRDFYETLLDEHDRRIALHRRYARVLSDLGEADDAIAVWTRILELTPGDRANREAYAQVLANAGRHDEAIAQIESLREQHPDDRELRIELAELQHAAGEPAAAAATLHGYLDASAGSIYDHLRTARLLERFELHDDAERVYAALLEAHGDEHGPRHAWAEFLHRQERTASAIAVWRELAEHEDRAGLLRVVQALSGRGEHDAAFTILHDRYDELAEDPAYLAALTRQAMLTDRAAEALPWAVQRVRLAETAGQLSDAIDDAVQLARRAERVDALADALAGLEPERSIGETCLLATLWDDRGREDEADALLDAAEARAEDPLPVVAQRVAMLRQRRDWRAAAIAAERLIELPGGQRADHLRTLVELHERAGDVDAALAGIEQWKRLSPSATGPWTRESELLVQAGRPSEAIQALRRAVQQLDGEPALRARLARLHSDQGLHADAQRIYWRLYEDTDDVAAKLRWVGQIAELARRSGEQRELITQLEQRSRTNRQSIMPYLALAETHRVFNAYEPRRQALMEASRRQPENVDLLLSIARMEELEGDYERALGTLERAAQLEATDRVQHGRVRLLLMLDRAEQAYRLLHGLAADGQPLDADGIEQIADAMIVHGDWERAAAFLQGHVADHPHDYRLAYLHAVALEESFQHDAALEAFLRVMAMDQPLARAPARQQANVFGSWAGPIHELMPAETLELFQQLSHWGSRAYAYRQRSHHAVMMPGAQSHLAVQLPDGVDAAHGMALVHVRALSGMVDEARRDRLPRDLERLGVALAEVLVALPTQQHFVAGVPASVIEAHGEEPAVAAMWVFSNMYAMGGTPIDPEYAKRVYEMFEDDRPELALMAALTAARAGDAGEELIPAALERVDEHLAARGDDTPPNPMMMVAMGMASGGLPGMPTASPALSDELQAELNDRLRAWYPRVRRAAAQGQSQEHLFLFMLAAGATARGDDAGAFVELLDEEVEAWRAASRSARRLAAGAGMFGGSARHGELIRPLAFPPENLPDFPAHVSSMLAMGRQPGMPFSAAVPEPAKLIEHLDKVSDPVLELMLADRADDEARVEAVIDRLLDDASPTLATYMLAAAHAAEHGDGPRRAIELLDRARSLPMDSDARQRLDAAVVAWALELDASEEGARQAGQAAALRLRRAQLEPNQRRQLADALGDLDLSDEAERLAEQIARLLPDGASPHALPTHVQPHQVQRDLRQRLERLLNDGQPDRAAALAGRELRNWAHARINMQSTHLHHWELTRIVNLLDAAELIDDVLAQVEPSDDASTLGRMRYARLLELFGREDEAIALYEPLLEARPNHVMLRLRMALLAAGDDPAAGAAHLAYIPDQQWAQHQVPNELTQAIHHVQNHDFAVMFDRLEMIAHWLEQRDPAATPHAGHLAWVTRLFNHFESARRHGSHTLGALFAAEPQTDAALEPLAERRRAIYERLAEASLRFPQLAEEGFKRLLALAELDGVEGAGLERFVELAEELLLDGPSDVQQSPQQIIMQLQAATVAGGRGSAVRFYSPNQFLVRHAWQTGDRGLIDDRIVPKLRESRRQRTAEAMLKYAELYFTEPDAFVEAAKAYREHHREALAQFAMWGMPTLDPAMSAIVEAWRERALTADLAPLILDHLEEGLAHQHGGMSAPDFVIEYLTAEHVAHDATAAAAFLEAVAERYIGPADERQAIIEREYDARRIQSGTVNARIHAYLRLLQNALQEPALLIPALDQYARLDMENDQIGWRARSAIDNLVANEPEQLPAVLEHSAILGDLDTFDTYPVRIHDAGSVLERLVQRLRQRARGSQEAREHLRSWLEQQEPQTFGMGLLHAMLADEPAAPLYEHLGTHLDAVRAMPAARRATLTTLIEPWRDVDASDRTSWSESARAAYALMHELHAARDHEQIEMLLKANDLEAFGFAHGNAARDRLADLVAAASERSVDLAEQVFTRAATLYNRQYNLDTTRRDAARSGGTILIDRLLDQSRSLEALALAARAIRDEPAGPMAFGARLHFRLQQPVKERTSQFAAQYDGDGDARVAGFIAFAEALAPHLGPPDASLSVLAPALWEPMHRMDLEALDLILAWAESDAARDLHAAWAAQIANATRVARWRAVDRARDATQQRREQAAADRDGALAHYRAILDDSELALTHRALIVGDLLAEFDDPALTRSMAHVFGAALRETDWTGIASMLNDTLQQLLAHRGAAAPDTDDPEQAWADAARAFVGGYLTHRERVEASRTTAPPHVGNQRWFLTRSRLFRLPGTPGADHGRPLAWTMPIAMIELALALEDDAMIRRVLRVEGRYIDRFVDAWVVLARHHKAELLLPQLRRFGREIELHLSDNALYDRELAEALPPLLERIDEPDLRFLVEVIFAILPDADDKDGEQRQPLQTRTDRLTALAERFHEITFADDRSRHRALDLLARDPAVAVTLRDAIEEAVAGESFVDLAASNDTTPQQQLRIRLAYAQIRAAAHAGDYQPLAEALDAALDDYDDRRHRYRRERVEALRELVPEAFDVSTMAPREAVALRGLTRVLATPRGPDNAGASHQTLNEVLHLVDDHADELAQWRAGLEHEPELRRSRSWRSRLWRTAGSVVAGPKPMPVADRIAFVQRVLRDPKVRGALTWQHDVFSLAVRYDVLSIEEVADHAMALAEDLPADWHWARLELAQYAEAAGRHDVAATLRDAVFETVDDNTHRLGLARTLLARDQPEPARRFLEAVDPGDSNHTREQKQMLVERMERLLERDE